MKRIVIGLIRLYHIFISPFLVQIVGQPSVCRYKITCSQYAIDQIEKHGIMVGIYYGVRRFLSCHS